MADDGIPITINLDDKSVAKGFANIERAGAETAATVETAWAEALAPLLAVIAAFKVIMGVKNLFGDAINSARESEKAVQALNVALGISGHYSQEASRQFQDLADRLQATTTMSDEQVMGLERLALTFSKTNEGALKLTQGSVALAAATGGDANTALEQLSATLSGSTGRLARHFPELQKFTAAQLRAGAAVDYFNKRFSGTAEAQADTFDGRLIQLGHSFDDLLKSVGAFVTKSPALKEAIKFVSEALGKAADYIKKFNVGQDFFKTPLLVMAEFGHVVTMGVIAPLEVLSHLIKFVADTTVTAVKGSIAGIVGAASFVADHVSPNSAIAKNLRELSGTTSKSFAEAGESVAGSLDSMFDHSFADKIDNFVGKFQSAIEVSHAAKDSFAELGDGAGDTSNQLMSLGDTFDAMKEGAVEALTQLGKQGAKVFSDLGGTAVKSLANGIASGMAAIGKALVTGKNIFQAFAGAVLSALGSAAIQMGAMYILMGFAREYFSYETDLTGPQLVGVGSAMAVAGGAMLALGDGVGGGGSTAGGGGGGGGGGSGGAFASDIGANPAQSVKEDRGAAVTVNIHGDVLDSNETGLRIVDLINGAFNNSGAKIVAQT